MVQTSYSFAEETIPVDYYEQVAFSERRRVISGQYHFKIVGVYLHRISEFHRKSEIRFVS